MAHVAEEEEGYGMRWADGWGACGEEWSVGGWGVGDCKGRD